MEKNLFTSPADADTATTSPHIPLADRMRPTNLDEVAGHADLVGPDGALRLLLQADSLPSLLLWGPPGCGKTTLARLVARHTAARFLEFSAVSVGTPQLKAVMADARKLRQAGGAHTILFLDEIHRFNKSQQDALLPWVERGDVTLIGATTENPSFEINSALMSRTRLFVLSPLSPDDISLLLERAVQQERGLDNRAHFAPEVLVWLAENSAGDARAALGCLETIAQATAQKNIGTSPDRPVTVKEASACLQAQPARYDKNGEEHYNLASALQKSLRNSDVDAALYWMARMLDGGEDPLYIVRRLVRFASEDVGLADPEALRQAMTARDAIQFIGLPEGALALSQAVVYLALAPKSNALTTGFAAVSRAVRASRGTPVPLHLRNAPTKLMKELGHGTGYVYAHDTKDGLAPMTCLPDPLAGSRFYEPRGRGFESVLNERMEHIKQWHERRRQQQRPTEIQED